MCAVIKEGGFRISTRFNHVVLFCQQYYHCILPRTSSGSNTHPKNRLTSHTKNIHERSKFWHLPLNSKDSLGKSRMLFLLRRSLRTGSTLPLAQILGGNGNALHVPSLSRSYSLSSSLIVRSDQLAVAAAGDGTLLKFRPVLWISRRFYCNLTEDDIRRRVEEISALFFEARELLDDAVSQPWPCYYHYPYPFT